MEIRYGMPLPEPEGGEGEGKIDMVDLFSQLFLRSNGDIRQTLASFRATSKAVVATASA